MAKHAVMVVMDLDVEVLDNTEPKKIEEITKTRVYVALEAARRGIKVKMLRIKLLGEVK